MLGAKGLMSYLHALGVVLDVQYFSITVDSSGVTSPQTQALAHAVPDFNSTFLLDLGVPYAFGDTAGGMTFDYTFELTDALTVTRYRMNTNSSSRGNKVAAVTLAPNVLRAPVQRAVLDITGVNLTATYTCAPILGPVALLVPSGQSLGDNPTSALGDRAVLSINAAHDTVTATRDSGADNNTTRSRFQLLDFNV